MFIHQLRLLSFKIIHSTTIALPAWRRYCQEFNLKYRIFPRDVVTRWNSTYYMLQFAIKYRRAIDGMTADKSLKLRKFELDDEEWGIVEDLVAVLQVKLPYNITIDYMLTLFYSNTRMQPYISRRIRRASLLSSPLWTG
jgi:hypothetical protein